MANSLIQRRRWRFTLLIVLTASASIAGAGSAVANLAPETCAAPTLFYARPADDRVAVQSLLEGAGYAADFNSDWVDVAAGNLCGGPEPELVLTKNKHSNFSILRGPTPFAVGSGDVNSSAAHPWRAVAAGNLDGLAHDEIVAVRRVTAAGVPDLVVTRTDASCFLSTVVASATIGTPGDSEWVDVAVGDFDGSGRQIALLKATHFNLFLVKLTGPTLGNVRAFDLGGSGGQDWKALAAGDIDGDRIDELIAARQVSDGVSATVIAFKLVAGSFRPFASARIGNDGRSDWASLAAGDFNGDGREAIVLVSNQSPNFVVLDLPRTATTQLRTLASEDLDSVAGQEWRGLVAGDWIGGDRGASELVAVRAAHGSYRTDLFVYGNRFHRTARDTGLANTRAQFDGLLPWDSNSDAAQTSFLNALRDTHANTVSWVLQARGDYLKLVDFLYETRNFCVDGLQLRVWVTLMRPLEETSVEPDRFFCSLPEESPRTPWSDLAFFPGDDLAKCKDLVGWGKLLGRLARDYPHLVALGIDDFSYGIVDEDFPISDETVAEMQSGMRSQSPWLNFVPTVYYHNFKWPDLTRTYDTLLFYFRNAKADECLATPCGEASVNNAAAEFADMSALLPAGRKLQVGIYYAGHSRLGEPSARYDYDLTRLVMNLPSLGGVTAYGIQSPNPDFPCTDTHFLNHKYCTLRVAFGTPPQYVSHRDLTGLENAPAAIGRPSAYVFPAHDVHNVIYRGSDGHVYELWRTSTRNGFSNLSAVAGAPTASSDAMGYVLQAYDLQNVVYRGTDGHLHGLYWSWGAVGHDDLTALSGAPGPAGAPFGYMFDAFGVQNVLYRGTDGRLHGLYWSTGAVGHDDLTALSGAPRPVGDPVGYVFDLAGMQNAVYRGVDGHLHALYWSTGVVGHDDLTHLSGAPRPAGDPAAYVATTYELQNVVYRGTDGQLHGLYWSFGDVGHDNLSRAVPGAPAPVGNPAAYFVGADETHHVIYRSANGHLHELTWTIGAVTRNDLTVLAGAPPAASDPAAYFLAADGSHHVVYRSSDGRLRDLRWVR
jgi:hypothetical protein